MEFKRRVHSPFRVLSDLDNGYALSLNLAIWIGLELKELLCGLVGMNCPSYQGE